MEENTLSTKVEGTESESEGNGGLQPTDDTDGGGATNGILIVSDTKASDYSGNNDSGQVCHESDATAEQLLDATCPLEDTIEEEPSEYMSLV